ncbi:MAG TPA: hypothetical protein VFC72_03040 [Corynebacterium sp.]|nr:hypothetical protein [Corynebacterium sp.]
MPTSDPDGKRTFLFSRKNIVGVIVAAVILVVHVIYGLGFLWPVVAVAGWGAAVLLTPEAKQPAAEVKNPSILPPEHLERGLDQSIERLYSINPPAEIDQEMTRLSDVLRWLFGRWGELDGAPEQQMTLTTMVQEFLPGMVERYLSIPDLHHPQAVADVVDSLQILREEAEETKQAVIADNVRQLEDHTRALRLQFGRLPGLQSQEDLPER